MIEVLLEAERSLAVGMLDHAERLYRQAADSDPRNAIAVVGLARVALERGDEQVALELGRRALQIDRENMAAQRLVDRLTVVGRERDIGGYVPSAAGPAPPAADRRPGLPPPSPDVPEAEAPAPPKPRRPGLLRRILRRG